MLFDEIVSESLDFRFVDCASHALLVGAEF